MLSSRTDAADVGGTKRSGTMSAFFVIANGKIQKFWEEPTHSPAGLKEHSLTCAAGLHPPVRGR